MEKPLHIHVAEAVGWFRVERVSGGIMLPDAVHPCRWKGQPPGPVVIGEKPVCVPRYDLEWAATGPLIERLGIDVWLDASDQHVWLARRGHFDGPCPEGGGPTPLTAVCNLILALHAAGKLP